MHAACAAASTSVLGEGNLCPASKWHVASRGTAHRDASNNDVTKHQDQTKKRGSEQQLMKVCSTM
jgi:hypothetical protein